MKMENARGLIKALENWAKRVTTGYKDVDVRDMSSSFRDGLAFCAIIHHYRPDLIDFSSLSKENILENNSLAFSVAEKQLGVPALLDAEDMVKFSRPDRLSIITYLSQLRNCFENQNKVNSLKPGIKRVKAQSSGPPQKVTITNPQLLPIKRHETCQVCKHRVFILERLIVDGKLYHTACFRCCKCNCLLNPGAYVESDTPGLYECSVCLPDENIDSTDISEPEVFAEKEKKNDRPTSFPVLHQKSQNDITIKQSPVSESVTRARSSFLNHSLSTQNKSNGVSPVSEKYSIAEDASMNNTQEKNVYINSVKEKISAFETNQVQKSKVSLHQISSSTSDNKINSLDTQQQAPLIGASNGDGISSNESLKYEHRDKSPTILCNSAKHNEVINREELFSAKSLSHPCDTHKDETENINDEQSCSKQSSELGISENKSEISTEAKSQNQNNKLSSSDSKTLGANKFQFSTQQSLFSDYKSPLRKPRDIFQTNIQPLKLSIPSVKREPSSLPLTPSVVSPASAKNFELPQIRSIYSVTLPRQNSLANFDVKEKTKEETLQNRTELRRKSLESNCYDKISTSESLNVSSLVAENKNISNEDFRKEIKYSKTEFSVGSDDYSKTEFSVSSDNMSESSVSRSEKSSECQSFLKSTEKQNNISSPTIDVKLTPMSRSALSLGTAEAKEKYSLGFSSYTSSSQSVSNVNLNSDLKSADKNLQASKSSDNQISSTLSKASKSVESKIPVKEETQDYPDDLNPFGIDEENNEEEYPDDLNPFGDEDESAEPVVPDEDYDESKNPFASDEDDTESATANNTSLQSIKSPFSSGSFSLQQNGSCSTFSSPSGSLKGTVKKRQAPKPPKLNDIFQNDSLDSDVSYSSKMSPSVSKKSLQTPSPKIRKNKPAPPPPPTARQSSEADLAADSKHMKEIDNMKLKTSSPTANENDSKKSAKQFKKKKRPAPPVPIPVRRDAKKIPLKEILREMKEIEEKQREYEKQGREIELLIRDRDKDEEASVEEEEYIMQLFELVNQKNALFRRQAELMYIKRSQRLEEQQYEVEKLIRLLMAKPESEKTDEDRDKEQELTMELIDIVDQRNSIIDSIEMDRRRELEEDVSVQEQLEIKNGDLPITAELKEKSSGKGKKSKKKDKKKHHDTASGESGKGTLKKKKWHLSKSS